MSYCDFNGFEKYPLNIKKWDNIDSQVSEDYIKARIALITSDLNLYIFKYLKNYHFKNYHFNLIKFYYILIFLIIQDSIAYKNYKSKIIKEVE